MSPIEESFNVILSELLGGRPETLCLGVSGGVDSLAMLFLTKQYVDRYGGKIIVVTVDHMLRNESYDEALYVKSICRKLNIEHYIEQWRHGKIETGKIEIEARNARYRIFELICQKQDCQNLLVAHNLDEQIETYFMRLQKKSGKFGLACMSAKRSLNDGIKLIRPCLGFRKSELQEYLTSQNVAWVSDSMNEDLSFIRVKCRQQVKKLSQDDVTKISNLIFQYGKDRQDVEKQSVKFLTEDCHIDNNGFVILNKDKIISLSDEVKSDIIKRCVKCVGKAIYSIADKSCEKLIKNFSGNCGKVVVKSVKGIIYIYRENRDLGKIVKLNKGDRFLWDNRFMVESLIDGLQIDKFDKMRSIFDLPSYIADTLPAFCINDKICHVGYNEDKKLGFTCQFVKPTDFLDIFHPLRSCHE